MERFFINRYEKSEMYNEAEDYTAFLNKPEVSQILKNMPQGLNNLEKAYYIYVELAKILNEDPNVALSDYLHKQPLYKNKVDSSYYGMCKSMTDLYINLLEKVGIKAIGIKKTPDSPISHVDCIIKIDGRKYLCNLVGDLTNVKIGAKTSNFGINLRMNLYDHDEKIDPKVLQNINRLTI